MNVIHFYTEEAHTAYLNPRASETKLGEKAEVLSSWNALEESNVKYVLLGIPEDIGVRANHGIEGTSEAWEAALKTVLNIQHNEFTNAAQLGILGAIDCDAEMQQAASLDPDASNYLTQLGELIQQLDRKVSKVVTKIIASDKIPIIIGGGHNNSYGNLKGAAIAMDKPINCINFDAHTDFRPLEHRHSGNGFSYAHQDGYLGNYYIFGLHRNYTSEGVFQNMEAQKEQLKFSIFEDMTVKHSLSYSEALQDAQEHCCGSSFGLELDLDAIEGMGSSAMTPSGFSMQEARQWVQHFSKLDSFRYLHICEGAPNRELFPNQVGKAISYLITDVIAN